MANHLPLVMSIFLFGIISVYSARLPDSKQSDNIYTDLSYENSNFDSTGVHQPNLQETRLSRVIRTPSDRNSESRRQQLETVRALRREVKELTLREANRALEEQKRQTERKQREQAERRQREEAERRRKEQAEALKQQQKQSKYG